MSTPFMNLTLPTVLSTTGPLWATEVNTALTLIDSHDHTGNKGVPVPTAGLNINADLGFGGFNATLLRSARFSSQSSALVLATDAGCLYSVGAGGDLYYNNGSGIAIQITSGNTLSATSVGGISGLVGTTGSAAYTSAQGTFTWTSNTNVAATMDMGPIVTRDTASNALGITIKSPAGLSGAYALTLPTALPGATALLSVTTGGIMSTFGTVSGTGLTIAGILTVSTSAAITSLTTSGTLTASGGLTVGASQTISAGSNPITNVTNPTNPQDAATKNYVDGKLPTFNLAWLGLDGITNADAQSGLSTNTDTKVNFVRHKEVGTSVTTNNTNRLTAASTGTYRVRASVTVLNSGPTTTWIGQIYLKIFKNGSVLLTLAGSCPTNAADTTRNPFDVHASGEAVIDLVATDFMEVFVFASAFTGSGIGVAAGSFSMERVA